MSSNSNQTGFSISTVVEQANWQSIETHLDELRVRVDSSITQTNKLREQYRVELLENNPDLQSKILTPSQESIKWAENLLKTGTVAASDGTISPVPLLGGSKIQVGVVIVTNQGERVSLVTRVFEAELNNNSNSATEFFTNLRNSRKLSNLLARAIMLFGERNLLLEHSAEWRLIHGELVPHELRTGAGRPAQNLEPTFELINKYINSEKFIAVSESSDDIDILNAAILLNSGEYIVIRSLSDTLNLFLDGDPETGQSRANFSEADRNRFREFIRTAGPQVSVVLVKAGLKPFLIECHHNRVEEAVSLFLADSLWTRGYNSSEGYSNAFRGFPFHIDLADQVARTLLKGSDFKNFVESRLFDLGIEQGIFEMNPRDTRG